MQTTQTIKYTLSIGEVWSQTPGKNILTVERPGGHEDNFDIDAPQGFQIWHTFESQAEAVAFVAAFPKYVGFRLLRGCGTGPEMKHLNLYIKLSSDGNNGGRNETGIKRIKALVAGCTKLGVELVAAGNIANQSPRPISYYMGGESA